MRDLISYNEDADNYRFLPASATVFAVLELFAQYERDGRTLDAILLTDGGDSAPSDELGGIVTYWDLTIAHREVQPRRRARRSV